MLPRPLGFPFLRVSCWTRLVGSLLLAAWTIPGQAQDIASQTICAWNTAGEPLQETLIEFWDAFGGYQMHSTETGNCADQAGAVTVEETPTVHVGKTSLEVYPNPALSKTSVAVTTASTTRGQVSIHDILGRVVVKTSSVQIQPGSSRWTFDAGRLAAGTYFAVWTDADGRRRTHSFVATGSKASGGILRLSPAGQDRLTASLAQNPTPAQTGSAHKSGTSTVRLTRAGYRQLTITEAAIENGRVNVTLEPGHVVEMYVREMTHHHESIIGGTITVTEGRTGLEQAIEVTSEPVQIVLSSDSTLWHYRDANHTRSRLVIQPLAPPGLDTTLAVYSAPAAFMMPRVDGHHRAPWWMSEGRYASERSAATLFTLSDSFDFDDFLSHNRMAFWASFYLNIRRSANYMRTWESELYTEGLTQKQLLEGRRNYPAIISTELNDAVVDSLSETMRIMLPRVFEHTWLDVERTTPTQLVDSSGTNLINPYRNSRPTYPGGYQISAEQTTGLQFHHYMWFDAQTVYSVPEYGIVFATSEYPSRDYEMNLISTRPDGSYDYDFEEPLKALVAVRHAFGFMQAPWQNYFEYRSGQYEVHPDEIRGGWFSLDGEGATRAQF